MRTTLTYTITANHTTGRLRTIVRQVSFEEFESIDDTPSLFFQTAAVLREVSAIHSEARKMTSTSTLVESSVEVLHINRLCTVI